MTTEQDFKRECEGLVREYFTHGVVSDVEDSLAELLCRPGWTETAPDRRASQERGQQERGLSCLSRLGNAAATSTSISSASPLAPFPSSMSAAMLCTTVVKRAVLAALDRGAREREMAAQLLRRLRATEVISRAHGEAGFDLLLQSLESLTIDVPNAPDDLHVFLARAVIDDVVSELFLEECADAAGLDVDARRVALSARGALKSLGGKGRVLDAWGGPDGGTASFANKEFDSLLTEYVESRDPREASRRVAALHVPFYHHELVKVRPCAFPKSRLHVCPYKTDTFFHNRKRALVFAIEESHFKPQCVRRITELLGYLGAAGVVSGTQFAKGFARVAVALKELALDTPDAQNKFERLVGDARTRGLLPAGLSAWASIRVGGSSSFGDSLVRDSGGPCETDDSAAGTTRKNKAGFGKHLMRLDSAPDLIALARSLQNSVSLGGPDNGASRGGTSKHTANTIRDAARTSRLSPGKKPHRPPGVNENSQIILAAVQRRVSKSNGVDANWSGLRAPGRAREGRDTIATGGGGYSGSDSDYVRPRPKRPLPDIRTDGSTTPSLSDGTTPTNPGSRGFRSVLTFGVRSVSPALGKSAWKARFQPAPARVSGEETLKDENSLRKARALRRNRSAPGGLHQLDNGKHIQSIGYVHRHRPFASEYLLGDAIGTGGFAVVRKATHRTSGVVYAVKTLRVRAGGGGGSDESDVESESEDDDDDDDSKSESGEPKPRRVAAMSMAEMQNELVMMQQLSGHPNIVTVKEFFTEDADGRATSGVAQHAKDREDPEDRAHPESGIVHVVMELLEGQELVTAIEEHGLYDESDARIVMGKMLDAIAFMHARGVVHRDLKLENLVLAKPDDLSSVTLVDFGLAKALMARERAENVCGTLAYVAPEALVAGQYGQGVDVWALGVAMHALLTGAWPFDDEDEDELMDSIIACELDFDGPDACETFSWISPDAKDLLTGLLNPNPKHRLTAAQALEHGWFTRQKNNRTDKIHHVHKRLDALSQSQVSISHFPHSAG